jgi:hypothetical protein
MMTVASYLCRVMAALYCVPLIASIELLPRIIDSGVSAAMIAVAALLVLFYLLVIYFQFALSGAIKRRESVEAAIWGFGLASPYLLGEVALPVLIVLHDRRPSGVALAFVIASGLHGVIGFVTLLLLVNHRQQS